MKVNGDWSYNSTFSWLRDYIEVTGQLCTPVNYPQGKNASNPLNIKLVGPRDSTDTPPHHHHPFGNNNSVAFRLVAEPLHQQSRLNFSGRRYINVIGLYS